MHSPLQFQRSPILGFSCIYAPFNAKDQILHRNIYGNGRVLGDHPRRCICTNASRGLSAIAEFLIEYMRSTAVINKVKYMALAEVYRCPSACASSQDFEHGWYRL